jgi:CubicO group peptidase (beta-lactamase class C family)
MRSDMNSTLTQIASILTLILNLCAFPNQAGATAFPYDDPENHGISAQSLEQLTEIVNGFVANNLIVGAEVVVLKDSYTVYHETFGWKDRDDSLPLQKSSYFNIRSMTKPITGAAVQLLVDEGKLELTDKAADYLPGFRNDKSKDITIEQLLTHHSGLPLTILTGFADYDDIQTMADSIGRNGPTRTPGAEFWYSDAGVDVLAAIVEKVSGEKLETLVEDHLLRPLGMSNTVYFTKRTEHKPLNVVSLYYQTNGEWTKYWKEGDEPLYSCP